MNDIEELKQLIRLHIATQSVDRDAFLGAVERIEREQGSREGTWVGEWTRLGQRLLARGELGSAVQAFNFARFPYVDGSERARALQRCLNLFGQLLTRLPGASREVIDCCGTPVPVYVAGTPGPTTPLLVVMGGIVSLKEQWYRTLIEGPRLGYAVVVADFPGVGENRLRFTPHSYEYLRALLDHFERSAPGLRAVIVGISFSGYVALRLAARDRRVAGVVVSGTPLERFFTDRRWLESVPLTTKRTLANVCGVRVDRLFAHLASFAVPPQELGRIGVPVHAIVSLQDDIVPLADARYLSRSAPQVHTFSVDDVHGGPRFVGAIRKYIAYGIVRLGFPRRRALALALRVLVGVELVKTRVARLFARRPARPTPALTPCRIVSLELAPGVAPPRAVAPQSLPSHRRVSS